MRITAARQGAVDIVRQLATDVVFRDNIRIVEIASIDGHERYAGPEEAWLFVSDNDEADGASQHP
jgi:hypothetical protein